MARRPHENSGSRSNSERSQQTQCVPPPRADSLQLRVAAPQQPPPPVPLSQMSMEELMQILPTLNAAIIAHDWIPCMQQRQQDLKSWLQSNRSETNAGETIQHVEKVSLTACNETPY